MEQATNSLWIMLLLSILACAEPEEAGQQAATIQAQAARPDGQAVPLVVPRFQLKEKPDVDSKTLAVLQSGDTLYLSGEVSNHRSRLSISGQDYERAWLFAHTEQGVGGWVHGAAVAGHLPLALQLQLYFEPTTARACQHYISAFHSVRQGETVLDILRQAHQLQATLSQQPGLQTSVPAWLSKALPGLQATWLEDVRRYQWYVDYGAFLPSALASVGKEDEQLLELYYLAYPLDSIGYRYPDWMLEVAPGKAYSLLGRGKYLGFLQAVLEKPSLQKAASPALGQLLELLLNDIRQPNVAFWGKRELVLQELRQIAQHPALDSISRLELGFRLQAWSADSLSGSVTFNHRAGVYATAQQQVN